MDQRLNPSTDQTLAVALADPSCPFLQPEASLYTAALGQAKHYLDPLAATVAQSQQKRLQQHRKKRKRRHGSIAEPTLRLKHLHIDGFDTQQVWEQARRILDASCHELDLYLPVLVQQSTGKHGAGNSADGVAHHANGLNRTGAPTVVNGNQPPPPTKKVRFDTDSLRSDSEAGAAVYDGLGKGSKIVGGEQDNNELDSREISADSLDDDGLDDEDLNESEIGSELDENGLDHTELDDEEEDTELEDTGLPRSKVQIEEDIEVEDMDSNMDSNMDSDMDLDMDDAINSAPASTFVPDKHGLNDGFFSIEDFNRTTDFLEQQDARGDPNDGAASDEEDIDWAADPMTRPMPNLDATRAPRDDDSEDDGPTFGNADLNAPFSDSDDGDSAPELDDGALSNTNDIRYADFFVPPPRPATKSKRGRPLPKTQPAPSQPTETDIQRTISAVRRDIFDDELSNPSDPENDGPISNKDLSTHQRRQATLAAQIRTLEAASIAKRDWTLSGEARAVERPLNSLLEEDLEFERTGKPVPVVTAAVNDDIEALIKRRILAREFDEVTKRRPGSLGLGSAHVRRGHAELADTKDSHSLAEIYEAEHLRTIDPANAADPRSVALKQAHAEIQRLWTDVSARLDALCSWHFRPKPPTASVHVLSDAPTVRMEDARPSGVGVGAEQSQLAPQEVFRVGDHLDAGQVAAGTGAVARDEFTREQRLRRRRRDKERSRKAAASTPQHSKAVESGRKADGGKQGAKQTADKTGNELTAVLKKGGVKVIGKAGQLSDIAGRPVKTTTGTPRAGAFKL